MKITIYKKMQSLRIEFKSKTINFLYAFILLAIISLCNTSTHAQCVSATKPILTKTFGAGTNQFSNQLPGDFGFTTTYLNRSNGDPNQTNDGEFAFTNSLDNPWGVWHAGLRDHTGDAGGYMMNINADYAPGEFYRETIDELCNGVSYELSAWIVNVFSVGGAINPNVRFEILDATSNALIASYETGDILFSNPYQWRQYSLSFVSPANRVILVLKNNNPGGGGNDLAIDDIVFKACIPVYKITGVRTLCSGENLNLLVSNTGDSYTNPVYRWQKKSAGIWGNIAGANTINFSLPNIAPTDSGWYRVLVSGAGNINRPYCRTEDSVYVRVHALPLVSASPKKATCLNGVAQNNASIELYNGDISDTNTLKYHFVRNNTYNGNRTYANATLLGQTSIISNLPNPNVPTNYTIRFFTKHGCTYDTTVTIEPVNCFCNNALASAIGFPTDSSFSTGLGTASGIDPNWQVSNILFSGQNNKNPEDLPSPNSTLIQYQNAIKQRPCAGTWADPLLLPAPFNTANWITGRPSECLVETPKYVYRYYRKTFVLPCNCGGNIDYQINQFVLQLNAYADNRILAIYINGQRLNAPNLPSSLTTFQLNQEVNLVFPGPWQAGNNNIEVLVENGTVGTAIAAVEGLLLTGNKTIPSLVKTKPKADKDFTQCYTIDTVDLVDATNTQKWSVLSSPKAITLNSRSGKARGLSMAGNYSFLITDTATNSCSDTTIITVYDTPRPTPKDTSVCEQSNRISPISSGNQIRWYFSQTGGNGVDTIPKQDISNAGTYNYWSTQNINSCESPRANSKIIVKGTPAKPSADTPLLYLLNQVSSPLVATGSNLKWYENLDDIVSKSQIIPATSIANTTFYYVSQTINGCEGPKKAIEVKVIKGSIPGVIAQNQTICENDTAKRILETTAATGEADGGMKYQWEYSLDQLNWVKIENTNQKTFQPPFITADRWYRRKDEDTLNGIYLTNTSFEAPYTPLVSGYSFFKADSIKGWYTSASDDLIEIWKSGFSGITAVDGNQFAELNATQNSRLYQYVYLQQGSTVEWAFKHRARGNNGVDVAELNVYSKDGTTKLITLDTATTTRLAWKEYTGQAVIPLPSGIYQFSFEAISTASGNLTIGNFLDDIHVGTFNYTNVIGLQLSPKPVLTIRDTAICNGKTTSLVSKISKNTGIVNYTWSPATGLSASIGASVIARPRTTQVYQVIARDANGCKDTASVTVTVHPKPILSISDTVICNGSSTSIVSKISNKTGIVNYLWSPATGLSATTGASVTARPTTTQAYQVIADDAEGCKDTASVTVTVHPKPILSISDTAICDGTYTVLASKISNKTGTVNYTWSPAIGLTATTGASVTARPRATQAYQVIANDAEGCKDTASVTITVHPKPVLSVGDTAICNDTSAILASKISNKTGTVNYLWSPATGLNATIGASVTARPTTTQAYQVIANDAEGCKDTASVTVTVHFKPELIVSDTGACLNDKTTLIANFIPNSKYYWGDAKEFNGTNRFGLIVTQNIPNYKVLVIDQNNCKDSITTRIRIFPSPKFNLEGLDLCQGETKKLSAKLDPTSLLPTSHTWTRNGVLVQSNNWQELDYNKAGNYTLKLYINGCNESDSKAITVHPNPKINMPLAYKHCFETDPALSLNSESYAKYTWLSEGTILDTTQSIKVSPEKDTEYFLKVASAFGCKDSTKLLVRKVCAPRLFVPNVITPESQDVNATLGIFGANYTNFEITVFSRWGEVIFNSKDPKIAWTGDYLNNKMPIGNYQWQVTYDGDTEEYKGPYKKTGDVSLIR